MNSASKTVICVKLDGGSYVPVEAAAENTVHELKLKFIQENPPPSGASVGPSFLHAFYMGSDDTGTEEVSLGKVICKLGDLKNKGGQLVLNAPEAYFKLVTCGACACANWM
jgi:hypothetical protein